MSGEAIKLDGGKIQEANIKVISLRPQQDQIASEIQKTHKLNALISKILAARDFKPGKILADFLEPTLKNALPHPENLKNLDAAVELIAEVCAEKKPIAICCDFDVDGLSGGAMLSRFLLDAKATNKVFVPDRFTEGYGLNSRMIDEIAKENYGLVVAVDYGTTSISELELAKSYGLRTIVIDHHHVESLPPADVFINPQQEGCDFADRTLCAAGLVWYLIVALRKKIPQAKDLDPRNYLDLACLGTICDMVPLVGANRVIAKRGLEQLSVTRRAGLLALKEVVGIRKEVTCTHIGFGIGPRINAAGRMVNAEVVIDLLTTTDSRKASRLAKKLNKLNSERQDTEARIKEIAIKRVQEQSELPWGLVVWDEKFHTGVIGIVAQRLVEAFYRPAIVAGQDNGVFKGSVRGIPGFSVVEALSDLQDFLQKFGGHAGAGGFSIEESKLESFAAAFDQLCEKKLKSISTVATVKADTEITLKDISVELVEELNHFSPFGIGNPAPSLLIDNLLVRDFQVLKGEHIKVLLSDGSLQIPGFLWKVSQHPHIFKGAKIKVACKPELNSFNGITSLQLNIKAVELSL